MPEKVKFWRVLFYPSTTPSMIGEIIDLDPLQKIVERAINKLFSQDASLLIKTRLECAVAHRLAIYIEEQIPGWHVDCEYHRQGESHNDPKAGAVRPDIIIHHRGFTQIEHNILVIEIKKDNQTPGDEEKIVKFTSAPDSERKFQYQYGLTLDFSTLEQNSRNRHKVIFTWFHNGNKRQDAEYTKNFVIP